MSGFDSRKKVTRSPKSPVVLEFDWATYDNNWRYRFKMKDEDFHQQFGDVTQFKSGNARNLKFISLEPALYTAVGRNKEGTHRISANICKPATMDILTVFRRGRNNDDFEVVAQGPWNDIKDIVTSNRNGGSWAKVVAVWLLEAEVAGYNRETKKNEGWETIRPNCFAYLYLRGYSNMRGWTQSCKDGKIGVDPDNAAGFVVTNKESYEFKSEKKGEQDRYYPAFEFIEFEDIPKIGKKLKTLGSEKFEELDQYLSNHFEHYMSKIDPHENDEQEQDDIPDAFKTEEEKKKEREKKEEPDITTMVEALKAAGLDEETILSVLKKKGGEPKLSKTEKAIEEKKKKNKGKEDKPEYKKVQEEEEEEEENDDAGDDIFGDDEDLPF